MFLVERGTVLVNVEIVNSISKPDYIATFLLNLQWNCKLKMYLSMIMTRISLLTSSDEKKDSSCMNSPLRVNAGVYPPL